MIVGHVAGVQFGTGSHSATRVMVDNKGTFDFILLDFSGFGGHSSVHANQIPQHKTQKTFDLLTLFLCMGNR